MPVNPPILPANVPTPPDYIALELTEWQANAAQVSIDLANRDASLLDRIKTFESTFGHTQASIEAAIATDPMFAATFAKSPSRADFDKREALAWLTQRLNLPVTRLPKTGQQVLYVLDNGDIAPFTGELKPSKALTFKWIIDDITYYAVHKYTRQSGGAQKNQFTATARTLENFQNATNPNVVLIIITDGDYYTVQKKTLLANLENTTTPKSFAVPIQYVPWVITQCP